MEHSTLSCGLRSSDVPVCVGGQRNQLFPENLSSLCLVNQFIPASKVWILERVESDLAGLEDKREALTLDPLSHSNAWHSLEKGTTEGAPGQEHDGKAHTNQR